MEERERMLDTIMVMQESNIKKDKQIEELEKKLAEKEEELENYKLCKCVNCTNEYEFMLEGLVEDLEKQIDKDEQDKISFAVEQLEKVKEIINKNYFYNMSSDSCTFDKLEVDFQIDNQIKELKKEQGSEQSP